MKKAVFAALIFLASVLPASAQMPDYRHWTEIRGYAGPHKVDGRVQRYYYVAKTNDYRKEIPLTTFYFVNGDERVRMVANAWGAGYFATHFYVGGHDFYIRENSFDEWRKVSWADAQKFLRENNIWLKKYEPRTFGELRFQQRLCSIWDFQQSPINFLKSSDVPRKTFGRYSSQMVTGRAQVGLVVFYVVPS